MSVVFPLTSASPRSVRLRSSGVCVALIAMHLIIHTWQYV